VVKKTEAKKYEVGVKCWDTAIVGMASLALDNKCTAAKVGYGWVYTTTDGKCGWGCLKEPDSAIPKPKVVIKGVVGTDCWQTTITGLASYDLWMKCKKAGVESSWIYTATDKCGWGCKTK